jgi:hypothetical protein
MTSSLLPEQIAPYEVFADCPLISGTPLVAHLLGRRFEQRLNERSDQPFDSDMQKALLKTLSHLCAVLGCSFGYADRTDLVLYAISQGSDALRDCVQHRRARMLDVCSLGWPVRPRPSCLC